MMKFKNIFLGLCIAAASLNTFAQQSDEHKDHHPEKTAPSAVTIKQTVTSTTATDMICAELAGDFHLGYARQLTDKSSLLFDLAF